MYCMILEDRRQIGKEFNKGKVVKRGMWTNIKIFIYLNRLKISPSKVRIKTK